MVRASYKDNSPLIAKAVREAPGYLAEELRGAFEKHALFFEGQVLAGFSRRERVGPFRRNTSNKLGIRTGKLSRSMRHRVVTAGKRISGMRLRLTIGNARTPYARIQHDGGVIRAKGGGMLAIPLPDNITPTGRQRFTNYRALANTFITESKAGNLVIGRRVGKGKRAKVQYLAILKNEVRVPARPYFVNVFNSKKVREHGTREFRLAALRALRRAGKTGGRRG